MKNWRILGIGAALLFAIILSAWLLRDLVYRFLIVPIQYLVWGLKILYLALPHGVIWAALLVLAYLMALNSLYRRPSPPEPTRVPLSHYAERRISQLARYISKRKRPFYRHRLKYTLTELTLQVITQKKRITLQEARNRIHLMELDVSPSMRSYLKDGLQPWSYGTLHSPGFLQGLLRGRRIAKEADDLDMQVLNYIEEQMESESDGNSPSL